MADLAPELRWREWLARIEAVLFASTVPVPRAALARVVGQGVSVDLLIADLAAAVLGRPYEVTLVADGWILRTRPAYASAIRAAAELDAPWVDLSTQETAVLAAIALHQPITRDGLRDIFGHDIPRDLIARLSGHDLIATGPRSPRRGAPYTYVTTPHFLLVYGMESLRDLPDPEQLADAGILPGPANEPHPAK